MPGGINSRSPMTVARTACIVLPIIVAAAAFGVTGTATANVATSLRATPTAPLVIGVDVSC